MPRRKTRLCRACFLTTLLLGLLSLFGCSRSAPVVKLDDAVAMTEETLITSLLGPPNSVTSSVPRDPPLLQTGVYETVLIAADAPAFVKLSRGALSNETFRDIEERVTKSVNKEVSRRGFSARRATYPLPADTKMLERTLVATLVPTTQEAGSPEDKARGRARQLILVRLTIADARTGEIKSARDYYSGQDIPRNRRDDDQNR